MTTNALITGWGMYAPSRVMTNEELSTMVDTSDEWIVTRTGIHERRIAAPDETTTTLSVHAARDALAVAGLDPRDLDLVIVGTCSPDYPLPATAVLVATELGATRAAGFDLQAACSGFLFALATGTSFIRGGMGAQRPRHRRRDPEPLPRLDRSQHLRAVRRRRRRRAPLRLRRAGRPDGGRPVQRRDRLRGDHRARRGQRAYPASAETVAANMHTIRMAGSDVYKYATRQLAESAVAALEAAHLTVAEIDQFVFHQANLRIIKSVEKALGIPEEKVFVNIEKYGNTSAASVPMALVEAVAAGRIKEGDKILMVAFGAGYTAGAAVVEWTADPARAFLAPGAQTRLGQPQRSAAPEPAAV